MSDHQVVTVAEGEYVIQLGTRSGRWRGGRFRGIDIPGGHYRYDVAFMYRLRDGRIAERWAPRDDLGMILQLTNVSPQSAIDEAARTETAPTRDGGAR
jgi:predicted ester cyclase